MITNRERRIFNQSSDTGVIVRVMCAAGERIAKWARAKKLTPGIDGHTPAPGGWWYRFDLTVPFTGTVIGFISGNMEGSWRIKRPGQPWCWL